MNEYINLDTIEINDLKIDCIVGINPWERLTRQTISIDIKMLLDLIKAGSSDSLHDTLDYRTIVSKISVEIKESSYGLIEALGTRVAEICLEEKMVKRVEVKVNKPDAIKSASSTSIKIIRPRT